MNEMRNHIVQVRRSMKQIESDLSSMVDEQKRTKKALREAEKDLESLSQKMEMSTQLENSSRERRLEQKKAKTVELEEEVEDKKSALGQAQEKVESLNQTLKGLRDEAKQCEHDCTTLRSKVQNLETQKNDKLNIWGNSVAAILRAIEARIKSFHRKPLGPLGSYLTLSESKWALAIENAIGDTFGLFAVHDHHDSRLLKECFRDAMLQRLPVVLMYVYSLKCAICMCACERGAAAHRYSDSDLTVCTSVFLSPQYRWFCRYDFDTPPYTPSPLDLPNPSIKTIFKVVESKSHIITNILMDQSAIERVGLVEDNEQSSRVAFDPSMNKNVISVYMPDGTVKFMRGSSQMIYPLKRRLQPRLGMVCDVC